MFVPLRDDNPRSGVPYLTFALIAANVLLQVYQATMSPERAALFLRAAGMIPLEIVSLTDVVRFPDHPAAALPIPLTMLSAMFVHAGWLHLLSNMWYLWLFGDNLELRLGRVRYLAFFVITGLVAACCQIAINPRSLTPIVGASGAVAGLLGGYARLFPHARVHTLVLIFVVPIPALLVLGLWFGLQLTYAVLASGSSAVAWFAHIGGFVAGLLLVRLFAPPSDD